MAPLDLAQFRSIVVLTGAGVSVASGLRPFRGPGGLWTDDPARMHEATLAAAQQDPMNTWRAFGPLRDALAQAKPNAGHLAIARAQRLLGEGATLRVITQNVDGLHQAAGSTDVIELHGNLTRSRCTACESEPFEDPTNHQTLPRCPSCGAPLRPDIVLFDEPLGARAEWESKRTLRDCDLFVAVGTSGTVSPASNFVRSADYVGARTIYVNLEALEPANPAFHETVLGRAEEVLPRLLGVDHHTEPFDPSRT